MKIQLDTNAKVIRLEESVNLGDLHELLEKLLPNGQWKEFKLETSVINNWSTPIVIEKHRYYPRPYPWWGTTIGGGSISYNKTQLQNGVYCLSVK